MASIERRDTTRGPVWRVRYRLNRRQRVLTFATEDGAHGFISLGQAVGWQHATDALAGARDTTDVPTVTAWVSHHIDSLSGITSGTRSTYRSYLDKSVAPFFEALPVTAVDDTLAASWVSWMADTQHLGGKSIRNRHALLSAALTSAVKAGLIPDNKIRGQRLPSTIQQETTFLQPADVDTLLAAIPQHYQLMVTVMVATGLRFGEITALQVRHITRDNGLRVTQAWKVTGKGGQRELGVPKSKKSIRTVAVPAALMPRIHAHVAGKKPGDLIFTNTTGGAIRQATFYTRVWAPAVSVLAGDTTEQVMDPARGRNETRIITRGPGPRPRVHDLRHTFASWAIQSGTPLPVIQRQLGHESITTTVDRYGHLARADFDAMAARISANLPGAGAPALAPGSSAPRSATLPQPQG